MFERLLVIFWGIDQETQHDRSATEVCDFMFTDRIESSEDPLVRRLAPKLEGSIRRAVSLCENTLSFGRAEEPAPMLNRFALANLVGDVIEAERLADQDHPLSYAEDIPAGLMINADAEQMFRVISNLVRNARQAIVASGQSGEIAVSAEETDAHWLIRVSDTGPGLPEKAKTHLFQAFQGNARKGGAGLGLAIAQELVNGHGGSLMLEKSDGEGTMFLITLPFGDTVYKTP